MAGVAVTVLLAGALPTPPAVGLPPPPQRLTPFRIPAAADFSSTVRGYFWDFSDPLHYGSADSRRGWDERLEDGWFIATSTLINPTVRLNSLNIPGTVPVPNEHADTPLNPSYRFVTMRMCSDRSTSAMVFWHRNASFEDGDLGATNFQSVRTGCHIYRFDLAGDRNPNVGTLPWEAGGFTGLRIRPVTHEGVTIAINYVTLTREPIGPAVKIEWEVPVGIVDVYFSSGPDGTRPTPIAFGIIGGSHIWQTPSLAPGRYTIILRSRNKVVLGPSLLVDEPARGVITAPSFTSGEDYATSVLGDPWDMTQSHDVRATRNLSRFRIDDGRFVGVNLFANRDGGLDLHLAGPVDPKRFRYFTYRMRTEADSPAPDVGGVTRMFF